MNKGTHALTKESKKVLSGEFGSTVKPFNKEVQKKCIGDVEPITCRPADLIEPQLPKFEKECAEWKQQEEDVLSYALFPQVASKFLEERNNPKPVEPVKEEAKEDEVRVLYVQDLSK